MKPARNYTSAIRTLELQALEALRQAAEPGATEAAKKSCLDTALAVMHSASLLQKPLPSVRPPEKKKARRRR